MTKMRFVAALLGVAVLAACDKNAVQELTGTLPTAQIKFFNFGLNAPGVNFYANDQKVTAVNTTACSPTPTVDSLKAKCLAAGQEAVTGVAYSSVGNGGLYSGIDAGAYTFNARIASATDNGLQVAKVNATLADGKRYSLYTAGTYDATAKTMDAFVIEDPLPAQDFTTAYVRFVNVISNSSPMTLYAKDQNSATEVAIGTAVAYKSAGAFVAVPQGVYDLSTRVAGSSTNAIVRTGVSFNAGRVYTISARGDMTVTSSTATNRPFLDNTANR